MSYVEPPFTIPGELVNETAYNRLVSNVVNHNARIAALEQGTGAVDLAVGSIILYWGLLSALDAKWAVCDGLNGTPDLRNRFVVGAGGAYDPGATGGAASHTHTNPATNGGGGHSHTFSGNSDTSFGLTALTSLTGVISNAPHFHTFSASPSEGNHTHTKPATGDTSVLPPYRAIYYIMRVA